MAGEIFRIRECQNGLLEEERERVFELLLRVVPAAAIAEIGTTAVSGAIGKQDVDIVVLTSTSEFDSWHGSARRERHLFLFGEERALLVVGLAARNRLRLIPAQRRRSSTTDGTTRLRSMRMSGSRSRAVPRMGHRVKCSWYDRMVR